MTLSTMMAVLSKVKDLANFSKKIHMPDNLSKEIFSSQATEIVGKVSSFCLETKPSWNILEEILIECKEMEAVDTTQLLQQYNHQGRHPGTRLVLPMMIQQHHVTQLHVHMIKQYLTLLPLAFICIRNAECTPRKKKVPKTLRTVSVALSLRFPGTVRKRCETVYTVPCSVPFHFRIIADSSV